MISDSNTEKISIIYINRNKDQIIIERSLSSLNNQITKNFEVVFVDYGSSKENKILNKALIESFSFCTYKYVDTTHLPWNRSHAINIGIKEASYDYIFTSDVDMIYHQTFTFELVGTISSNTVVSFRVAYLKKSNNNFSDFSKFRIESISKDYSHGMTLFYRPDLEEIGLFDEKFIFWGGEDNDVIIRLKDCGVIHSFFDKCLVYHQWHPKIPNSSDNYYYELSNFLLNDFHDNIFCSKRSRGEIDVFNKKEYQIKRIEANRVNFTFKLNDFITQYNSGKFCFSITVAKKREYRNSKGKTTFMLKRLNKILDNLMYKVIWKGASNNFSVQECILEMIKFKTVNRDSIDIQGMIIKEDKVNFYIEMNE